VGALACHYLDLFLLAAGAAWLIDRILPAEPSRAQPPAAPEQPASNAT
jgi:hypothetical protein